MVEAQRIRMESTLLVQLYFRAKSDTFETPATDFLGGPFYPGSRMIDLAQFPIAEGLVFTPRETVSGVPAWGKAPPPPPPITFRMNGRTAIYKVAGTTSAWTVSNDSLEPPSGRPDLPGFPAQVPLFKLPYRKWFQDIQVTQPPEILTCAPRTCADVAAVCNWARQNGYQVRPRGVIHGWSPLSLPTTPTEGAKVLLVDLTKSMHQTAFLPAADGLPNRVKVGAGATLLQLLRFLEAQPGGKGAAPGYSFPHTPAPGNLTIGGVLAIGAHGTAVRTPPHDDMPASYGSMSNQVLAFTAVCTDPSSPNPDEYRVRCFSRSEPDAKALLVNLGRTLMVDATLQVVDNYNLRCESRTDVPASTLFAAPNSAQAVPPNSFAEFFNRTGRVEIIWFPFSEKPPPLFDPVHPWLHVWTVSPEKPRESIEVDGPYNYPFADHVSPVLQDWLPTLLKAPDGTPLFGYTAARITADGLKDGKSRDIWGPSKNTLLYVQDTTLRVIANGYAIHLKKRDVQKAVAAFAGKFSSLLEKYEKDGEYPVNSPLEIRVTGLDDPAEVHLPPGAAAGSPALSATTMDEMDRQNSWDVALWFDVLTIPGTSNADKFYVELEQWLLTYFSDPRDGVAGRVMPEWSKGFAYDKEHGPWTDADFLEHVRHAFGNNWADALATLAKYDKSHLFSSPFLDELLRPA
jgi:hypothetical protein